MTRRQIPFSFILLFALVLIFVSGQHHTAEARNVYVGTYSDDGSDAYLLTETVNIYNYHPLEFTCTVYATGDHLRYHFFRRNGESYYRNSEGYEGYTFGGQSPVAANIYRFVVNYY